MTYPLEAPAVTKEPIKQQEKDEALKAILKGVKRDHPLLSSRNQRRIAMKLFREFIKDMSA